MSLVPEACQALGQRLSQGRGEFRGRHGLHELQPEAFCPLCVQGPASPWGRGLDIRARAFDLGKATRMHTPGAGSLPSLVCVVEQGGCRRGGLAAAVQGCSVPCLHAGGSWRPPDPLFIGKWQLWEGGLIRLYGHQGDGGWRGIVLTAGLWGQQDRNAYNTPLQSFCSWVSQPLQGVYLSMSVH